MSTPATATTTRCPGCQQAMQRHLALCPPCWRALPTPLADNWSRAALPLSGPAWQPLRRFLPQPV